MWIESKIVRAMTVGTIGAISVDTAVQRLSRKFCLWPTHQMANAWFVDVAIKRFAYGMLRQGLN